MRRLRIRGLPRVESGNRNYLALLPLAMPLTKLTQLPMKHMPGDTVLFLATIPRSGV